MMDSTKYDNLVSLINKTYEEDIVHLKLIHHERHYGAVITKILNKHTKMKFIPRMELKRKIIRERRKGQLSLF